MNWEMFNDDSHYNMWAVRPTGDRDFNSPRLFHFAKKDEAEAFKKIVEKARIADLQVVLDEMIKN